MTITLATARVLVREALTVGRAENMMPLTVAASYRGGLLPWQC